MVHQGRSPTTVIWDAILLGSAIVVTIVAGAYHLNEAAARPAGIPIASYGETASLDETDGVGSNPAADGSIIIECMALGDRAVPAVGASRDGATPLLVTVPRYQLGPSTCWHDPHQRS